MQFQSALYSNINHPLIQRQQKCLYFDFRCWCSCLFMQNRMQIGMWGLKPAWFLQWLMCDIKISNSVVLSIYSFICTSALYSICKFKGCGFSCMIQLICYGGCISCVIIHAVISGKVQWICIVCQNFQIFALGKGIFLLIYPNVLVQRWKLYASLSSRLNGSQWWN